MRISAGAIAAFILFIAVGVQAQLNRSFVSTAGADTNPCTPLAPCRSFDAAIARTNPGGEVLAVDSGGYGPFTVTGTISIVGAPGIHAAVTGVSGTAVTIDAGSSDTVVLRGLSLIGQGASYGVDSITARAVHLEGCSVSGFTLAGARFRHAGYAFVTDGLIRKNQSNIGIFFQPELGHLQGTVDRTRILTNNIGMRVFGDAKVTVNQSVAAGNSPTAAFQVIAGEGVASELTLESTVIANNSNGAVAFVFPGVTGEAIIRLSNCTITGQAGDGINTIGTGAQVLSFGNNRIHGNGSGIAPTGTLPQQ